MRAILRFFAPPLAALAVLLTVPGPLADVLSQAPGGATTFGACIDAAIRVNTTGPRAQPIFRVPRPANAADDQVDLDRLIQGFFHCSVEYGDRVIMPMAMGIFWPLVIIVTVLQGVSYMFGRFDMFSLVTWLMRIGFALILLQNYYHPGDTAGPFGTNRGIVALVAQQAVEIGSMLVDNANEVLDSARIAADEAVHRSNTAGMVVRHQDPNDYYRSRINSDYAPVQAEGAMAQFQLQVYAFVNQIIYFLARFLLVVLRWVAYAQFLWGYMCFCVLALVGPLFIPWLIFHQLEWLAMGWIKALIQTAFYMITAGATYVMVASILAIPLYQLAQSGQDHTKTEVVGFLTFFYQTVIENITIGMMAAVAQFRASSLSGALLTGGAVPGGGFGDFKKTAMGIASPFLPKKKPPPPPEPPDAPAAGPEAQARGALHRYRQERRRRPGPRSQQTR